MRARNLKPGFFKNAELADAGPIAQLLFAGLWLMADKEGRLKDQPRVIKAELFPYYDADVNGELTVLARLGHVRRYVTDRIAVIEIINFKKHQSPHHTERASELPAYDGVSACNHGAPEIHGELTVNSRKHNGGNPSDSLIPDSLIPDSPNHESPSASSTPTRIDVSRETKIEPEWWLDFKLAYPNRSGDQGWRKAQRAAHARMAEGHTPDEFIAGAKRYAEFCVVTEKAGSEFVKQACTFLGPDKPFLLPWAAPPTKADRRLGANLSAAEEFMRRTQIP